MDYFAEDVDGHAPAEKRDIGLTEVKSHARANEVGEVAHEHAAVDAVELQRRPWGRPHDSPVRHVQVTVHLSINVPSVSVKTNLSEPCLKR